MQNISGSFYVTALIDGTTINGLVRVENLPLVQRYKKGTTSFTPDFEALAENSRPVALPLLRLTSDGTVVVPSSVVFKYNSIALAFDATTKLCTTSGFTGMFKLIDYSLTINSVTYVIPAIRVMKNLVPVSSYDNDLLTISGTVELGGQQIPFAEMSKEIVIEETTGNQYDVVLSNNKGSQLVTEGETLTETAAIYKDGVLVTDLTGFSFAWYKVLGSGDSQITGTSSSITIANADVDNVLKVRCDVSLNGSKIASGYDEITDFTDPYDMAYYNAAGVNSMQIKKGETLTVTPRIVKRSTGDVITGYTFQITTKNSQGVDFILASQTTATFTATSVNITYTDVMNAGRGLSGYVLATKS